jgi:hypothetical protein
VEQEQRFARSYQAKVLPGQRFDCARVVAELSRRGAQSLVVGSDRVYLGCELLVRTAGGERGKEPAVTDEGVRDEHRRYEEQAELHGAPPWAVRRRYGRVPGGGSGREARHVREVLAGV